MINTKETYEVTHACGHTKMWTVSRGPIGPRMMNLLTKVAPSRICDACAKKHENARTSMVEAAEERSKTIVTDAKLTGTPKQVEWAESLRANWRASFFRSSCKDVPAMEKTRRKITENVVNASSEALEIAITNVLAARLAGVEEALSEVRSRFWIDDRQYHYHFNSIISERENTAIKSAIALLTKEAA